MVDQPTDRHLHTRGHRCAYTRTVKTSWGRTFLRPTLSSSNTFSSAPSSVTHPPSELLGPSWRSQYGGFPLERLLRSPMLHAAWANTAQQLIKTHIVCLHLCILPCVQINVCILRGLPELGFLTVGTHRLHTMSQASWNIDGVLFSFFFFFFLGGHFIGWPFSR